MPWSLSLVLTSQPHQHGNAAFEKAGVRVMSIWKGRLKSIFSLVLFGVSKFLHYSVANIYSPLSVCLTKLSEEIIIIGRDVVGISTLLYAISMLYCLLIFLSLLL